MVHRNVLSSFDEIPNGANICLYGTGETASTIMNYLKNFRKDIKIVLFLDSFNNGEKYGIKIIKPENFLHFKNEIDLIIIASMYWNLIEKELARYRIEKYKILSNYLLYLLSPLKNQNSFFLSQEEMKFCSEVINLFKEGRDKELYHCLINFRIEQYQNEIPENFLKVVQSNSRQYLDFINFSAIHTILEGGVYDGTDTVNFLNQLKGKKYQIFGFEPNLEFFKKSPNKNLLSNKNVKIFPNALWRKKETLKFRIEQNSPSSSNLYDNDINDSILDINAITIDEFLSEQHISTIDFIKLDIEGAELDALLGAENTIKQCIPQLAISIYHNKNHLFQIPKLLHEMNAKYVFKLGQYSPTFIDSVLYAIPESLII